MQNIFVDKTFPQLLDIILMPGDQCDNAMWYVLHERMATDLASKFKDYENKLWSGFDDLIDDFFLYLREGKDGCDRLPYTTLRSIRNKDAFDKWILSTWKNFLNNLAEKEETVDNHIQIVRHSNGVLEAFSAVDEDSDEHKIEVVSQLIAYCDQVFLPRGRFIFLRTLLTLLDKQNALPEKEMAEALGMTDIYYRVTNHRLKVNVKNFLTRLLHGESLRLDAQHKEIADRINQQFNNLYPVLMLRYEDVLTTLKQRKAIEELRQKRIKPDGSMLHEEEWKTYHIGVRAFLNRLRRELNR